ncbi:anoctamin-7-like isoform X1 [Xiphophorus couchianus]|uniref:anoctamin-7-like isoform X1 n=1 Tax=Xiphophorus couchianus TaxID=32473 RepID=UPI0010166BDF|nr:anoctamin-7-like isoform X1 [Xiphophorus couchianus]
MNRAPESGQPTSVQCWTNTPPIKRKERKIQRASTLNRNVFRDGKIRIDFVLVWEELRGANENDTGNSATQRKWREQFLSRLRQVGLLQEQREIFRAKKRIRFILLSAPWRVLCYYAEEINLKVPLEVVTDPMTNWSEHFLSKLSLPNPLSQNVPNPPLEYYTCQFKSNKLERFLGSGDKETFFKTTQRHQVLYEILARTPYGSVNRGEVGIDRLISEEVFTAAYPLHEGDYRMPDDPVPLKSLVLRQILHGYWSKWSCWRRYQPLGHIREYFGEKIALYFAWIGFYTAWLLPASLIGTLVFLLGFVDLFSDVPAKEVCESGNSFIMCPLCNICSTWNYSSICITYKAGLLFDNWGTVFLSLFMSLWAVTFLEYWRRTSSTLSHRWGCSDFEDIEERPRPEFSAMAPMTTRNPITGAEEPYFPENKRFHRTVTGCMVIIVMISVVPMFLISIILYRTILRVVIYKSTTTDSSSAGTIASISASVLNLIIILTLSRIYTWLAGVLTRWEMHRTQTKYEDMFILKVFIFQFVNFYSTPVYIAFFKGRFVGYPGMYNTLFGLRNEECGAGGCLIDLAQELLVIMVGKQMINNVHEFISPKVQAWWQKNKIRPPQMAGEGTQTMMNVSPWEADYDLLVCEGLFGEYLEMVLQFGFITIFVAACPLAPLFALMNNWVEIRLDAQKYVREYRRPVVERAQDIGIWFHILQFISHIAVISNACLIAFTSSFVPRLYYRYTRDSTLSGFVNFTLATAPLSHNTTCKYRGYRDDNGEYLPEYFHLIAIRLSFVVVFEHVVFFIGRLIDLTVSNIPEEVEIKIKREHYVAKQALAENKALGKAMMPNDKDVGSGHCGSRSLVQLDPCIALPTHLITIPEKTDPASGC